MICASPERGDKGRLQGNPVLFSILDVDLSVDNLRNGNLSPKLYTLTAEAHLFCLSKGGYKEDYDYHKNGHYDDKLNECERFLHYTSFPSLPSNVDF